MVFISSYFAFSTYTDLILRSREAASRRMGHGPHGSPGDAKHRPETALKKRLLTMRITYGFAG
jgi:hypothetical protein